MRVSLKRVSLLERELTFFNTGTLTKTQASQLVKAEAPFKKYVECYHRSLANQEQFLF